MPDGLTEPVACSHPMSPTARLKGLTHTQPQSQLENVNGKGSRPPLAVTPELTPEKPHPKLMRKESSFLGEAEASRKSCTL